jgi:primase-polymerase (primpol)-like protein
MTLPAPLWALGKYPQFILWTIRNGKKLPIDYSTLQVCSAHDPAAWMDYPTAELLASPEYRVGFVFAADPFFFLDIDNCRTEAGWSPLAMEIIAALPGAAIEVSQSGKGLHIFGRYQGTCPPHACKNAALGLELYHEARFVALTCERVVGDASTDCTAALAAVIAKWFPSAAASPVAAEWTDVACEGYSGPADDATLLSRAMASNSAGATFGGRARFKHLWEADEAALGRAYPDPQGARAFDASSADAALAQHLAFWTGKN